MSLNKLSKFKFFLGTTFLPKVKDVALKLNEVIDTTNSLITSTTPAYKVYTAKITTNGSAAPTATIMQNTLGFTPVYINDTGGEYRITSTAGFTINKTAFFITNASSSNNVLLLAYNSASELYVYGGPSDGSGDLAALDGAIIEIRVYN